MSVSGGAVGCLRRLLRVVGYLWQRVRVVRRTRILVAAFPPNPPCLGGGHPQLVHRCVKDVRRSGGGWGVQTFTPLDLRMSQR